MRLVQSEKIQVLQLYIGSKFEFLTNPDPSLLVHPSIVKITGSLILNSFLLILEILRFVCSCRRPLSELWLSTIVNSSPQYLRSDSATLNPSGGPPATTTPPADQVKGPALLERLADRIDCWWYCHITRPWRIHSAPYYFVLASPHPINVAIMLLWPYPRKYSVPPPLSVQYLLDHPETIDNRRRTEINYVTMRKMTLFCKRDTPLRSLYRLYETVVTSHEDEMMQESQYWFHDQPDWHLEDIPDPQDPDPLRYAILASLADALVMAFNHKIKYGMRRGITDTKPLKILEFRNDPNPPLERAPSWCVKVGGLSERLVLGPGMVIPENLTVLPGPPIADDGRPFFKRNMIASFAQLFNL